jgi:pimeloyl-ACP methyl ester carboxylesterase
VLVGHIIGGAIAARYAIDRGDRLAGLVLVDALGLQPFQPAPAVGDALTAFAADPNEQTHDALWDQCAFDFEALRNGLGDTLKYIKAYNLDRARASDLGPA